MRKAMQKKTPIFNTILAKALMGMRNEIKEAPSSPATCKRPDHDPPTHQVHPPGNYDHTCPWCGRQTVWTVPEISMEAKTTDE